MGNCGSFRTTRSRRRSSRKRTRQPLREAGGRLRASCGRAAAAGCCCVVSRLRVLRCRSADGALGRCGSAGEHATSALRSARGSHQVRRIGFDRLRAVEHERVRGATGTTGAGAAGATLTATSAIACPSQCCFSASTASCASATPTTKPGVTSLASRRHRSWPSAPLRRA